MNKRYITVILFITVCVNACKTQEPVTPDIYSTSPSPLPIGSPASALPQQNTPQPSSSYAPTLVAGDSSPASPTIEVFDTPTFSPTLTPIPALKLNQAIPFVNMYMMDELSGWGIEENGHIVHTKDGASTWEDVTPPQGAYFRYGFFALDGQTAWATPYCLGYMHGGGLFFCEEETNQTNVWITRDGGKTWLASSPICLASECSDLISSSGDESLLPESIRFIDPQHGWFTISRGSHMYQNSYNGFYTRDGGKSWDFLISEYTNSIISGSITALEALDEKKVFLFTNQAHGAWADIGNDLRYSQSNDGGNNWSEDIYFTFPTNPLNDPVWDTLACGTSESKAIPPLVLDLTQECHFFNGNHQNANYFIHLHSEDGGKAWKYWQQTGDVDFINAKTGWQLVAKDDTTHELQQTQDGGLTWVKLKTVEWDGVLNFVNDQIGYALAYNQGIMAVMRTTDGGKTWEMKSQATLSRIPCLLSTWDICEW